MNVLIAVDLSENSGNVLDAAKRFINAADAAVFVLHVAAPDPDFVGYDAGPQTERDAVASHLHADHKQVQALAEALRGVGINATALLIPGPTSATILAQADKLEADIIVVGSHGKGALAQLLVGSVSEGVLREARCPVVVVPTR